ncbi:MAG TPA: VTT domain-containing protein [Verrucomicrobiae bacterium]|nr:VTT domain-containing protein [Verrucomicrobiae bacterium]
MMVKPGLSSLILLTGRSLRHTLVQLGGVGLIPLGLLDSSLLPLPGSMDIATIFLAARDTHLWLYYALMATAGSVAGGFITYRLARKGGKEALEHRSARGYMHKVCEIFEKWGFAAVAIPALLPPPAPVTPFVVAAGAMQYSLKKFLAAFTSARLVRYVVLASLAAHYGHQIIDLISHNLLLVSIVIALLLGAAVALAFIVRGGVARRRAARKAKKK